MDKVEIKTLIQDINFAYLDGNFKRCSTPSKAPRFVKNVAYQMRREHIIDLAGNIVSRLYRPVPINKDVLFESMRQLTEALNESYYWIAK